MSRTRQLVAFGLSASLLAGASWYVLEYSPLLVVKKITIEGVDGDLKEQVTTLVTIPKGTPLLQVDGVSIANKIEALPSVRTASVRRGWPNTLVVDVAQREPLAWASGSLVGSNTKVVVVDNEGEIITKLNAQPAKLVEITVGPATPGGLAALNVYEALPADIRSQVTRVGSEKPNSIDSVTLELRNNSLVLWGSAELIERKAEVLRALLPQKADRYDVSAPDLPTTVTR